LKLTQGDEALCTAPVPIIPDIRISAYVERSRDLAYVSIHSCCNKLRLPTGCKRSRDRFLEFFAQRPPATVLLEACGSAHYWARQLQPFGHAVRLLAPHDVRPYVRRRKTGTDATRWSRRGLTTIIVSALFGVPAILVATVAVPVGDGGLA